MMKSEFIERTGFEPTAEEYDEIEREYMGCNADKDAFCKQWKKQGGIGRMISRRARRIEELESELEQRAKKYDELDAERCRQISAIQKRHDEKVNALEKGIESLRQMNFDIANNFEKMKKRCEDAERKLAVLKEAFEILTGKGKTA